MKFSTLCLRLVLCASAVALSAQDASDTAGRVLEPPPPGLTESNSSRMYYVNLPVVKVFSHRLGYRVIYRRANFEMAEIYLPSAWFSPRVGKALLRHAPVRVDPYLSFFMEGNTLTYVKLTLPRSLSSPVWGTLKSPSEYDDKFDVQFQSPEFSS